MVNCMASLIIVSCTQFNSDLELLLKPLFCAFVAASIHSVSHAAMKAQWQWEHRRGWRDYAPELNAIIDEAFSSQKDLVEFVNPRNHIFTTVRFTDMLQVGRVDGDHRRVQCVERQNRKPPIGHTLRAWPGAKKPDGFALSTW